MINQVKYKHGDLQCQQRGRIQFNKDRYLFNNEGNMQSQSLLHFSNISGIGQWEMKEIAIYVLYLLTTAVNSGNFKHILLHLKDDIALNYLKNSSKSYLAPANPLCGSKKLPNVVVGGFEPMSEEEIVRIENDNNGKYTILGGM